MSVTLPSPPGPLPRGRISRRWRAAVLATTILLALLVTAGAILLLGLHQRRAVLRLHQTAAAQAQAALAQSLIDTQQALAYAAQITRPRALDFDTLRAAIPALRTITVRDEQGRLVMQQPDSDSAAPDASDDPAWDAAARGENYAGLSQENESTRLVVAVPGPNGSAWIAELDAARLWAPFVAPAVGRTGRLAILSADGDLLAVPRTPAANAALPEPDRAGTPSTRLYRGLDGDWVIGRAERVPQTPFVIVTETPLADWTPLLLGGLALAALAVALAIFAGELLVTRVLLPGLHRPLAALRQGGQAAGASDYGYRVRMPPGAAAEWVELGRAFNQMNARLQDFQQQVDRFHTQVAETVDQRARELARKTLRLETAAELSGKIATILDPRTLAQEAVALVQARFQIYFVDLLLVDADSGAIMSAQGKLAPPLPPINLRDAPHSVVAWAARHGETVYVPDVTHEARYLRVPERPASQSELAIPLRFGGRVTGVLNLESEHRDGFAKDDIDVLEGLAAVIAAAIHNSQVFQALETANRDLAQATLQAKQASVLKSRFLFNASHKLRTPLNAIIGYSETTLSGLYGPLPDKALDRQRRILENGRQLQALIEDMLDLSSIESGRLELKRAWVELPPLLEEIMLAARALHQTAYPQHDVTLALTLDGTLPPVWADPDRLRYILMSLLDNAVKFTASGAITVSAESDAESVCISVKDTGPGIREDEMAVLFEPFQHQRGATESSGKGTGLGLPVSRLLALLHGGDLTVDSTLHQGSTFTLQLPCHPAGAPPRGDPSV